MGFDIEQFEDDDDKLPMVHRVAKVIITGLGALFMREMLNVYYDHSLTSYREAKEKEKNA
jgi:hypothetical protein